VLGVKVLSQQTPQRGRYSLHMIFFIISIVLMVVSLLANAVEFVLLNDYIMRHGSWGDIPLLSAPWWGSLVLLSLAILLGIVAECQKE
jgi:hypothetical protein